MLRNSYESDTPIEKVDWLFEGKMKIDGQMVSIDKRFALSCMRPTGIEVDNLDVDEATNRITVIKWLYELY